MEISLNNLAETLPVYPEGFKDSYTQYLQKIGLVIEFIRYGQ